MFSIHLYELEQTASNNLSEVPSILLNSLKQFYRQKVTTRFDNPKPLNSRSNLRSYRMWSDTTVRNHPNQQDGTRMRRRKGYTNTNLPGLKGNDKTKLFSGVEKLHKLVVPIILSVDGVEMGMTTKYSAYTCTAFAKTMSKYQEKQELNGDFLFICPSNAASLIEHAQETSEELIVKIAQPGSVIANSWRLDMGSNSLLFEHKPSCSNRTPADSDFRKILSCVLSDIRKNGDEGFFLRRVCDGYEIHYGVLQVVMDLPALACVRDSSGLIRASNPCPFCNLHTGYMDPLLGIPLPVKDMVLSKGINICNKRKYIKTLNSAMTTLHPRDPLRLLPVAMYIKAKGSQEVGL